MTDTRPNARHVADYLRTADRDRYLATLLLTGEAREAVQALYAFNADVASIRDRAHQPAPGEIRVRWWVDALEGEGHGDVRQNPLAAALLDAIFRHGLPKGPLQRLLAARRFDLYDDPMPDVVSFEGYAGETVSVLYQLSAMVLHGGPIETGDAAGHLGVAHALIGHLRAFGFHAARGQLFLPRSVFTANGVDEKEIFAGIVSEGLLAARQQLAEMAAEHLSKFEEAVRDLPRPVRRAFGPCAVLRMQLRALEARGDAVFEAPRESADWRKIAALAFWAMRA